MEIQNIHTPKDIDQFLANIRLVCEQVPQMTPYEAFRQELMHFITWQAQQHNRAEDERVKEMLHSIYGDPSICKSGRAENTGLPTETVVVETPPEVQEILDAITPDMARGYHEWEAQRPAPSWERGPRDRVLLVDEIHGTPNANISFEDRLMEAQDICDEQAARDAEDMARWSGKNLKPGEYVRGLLGKKEEDK